MGTTRALLTTFALAGSILAFPALAVADHCSGNPLDYSCHGSGECDPCDPNDGCYDCPDPCQNNICFTTLCPGYDECSCAGTNCSPECGDGSCNGDETPLTCPGDCTEACGNGTCDEGEDHSSCPADCDSLCGNGTCDGGEGGGGETFETCPDDCPDPCEGEDPCSEGECYDFTECCELEACSDFACPGYCDGPCDLEYCCQNGTITEGCPAFCGDGACDPDEDCQSCPDDCDYDPCDQASPCYDFTECCELERCSDPACPGYCDEDANGGACDLSWCCGSGQLDCCGGTPRPEEGEYECCALDETWHEEPGECCGETPFGGPTWCAEGDGRCMYRNRCYEDGSGAYCQEDAETLCAVAITHECTAGRDYQCQNYCDEHPDDPCCIDPASCSGNAVCDDGLCTVATGDCVFCPQDCTTSECTGPCADPCSNPECSNYPGPEACNCGNRACDVGECESCPSDCTSGNGMYCGDGICAGAETGLLCPSDCPAGSPGSVYGCTDPDACNYDSGAEVSDGSCTYPGCTDPSSVNYDPAAGCSGSCLGPAEVCAISGSYEAQVTCGDAERRYAGVASCDAPTENGVCPCNENALAANAAYGAGSLCGATLNTYTVGGSGYYAFRYAVTEVCPAGQVRVDGGCAESCPDGDGDGDGLCDCFAANLCDTCDPCQDIDDPDISSDAARAAAGLREPDANGQCCADGDCCEEPGHTYMPDENACRPDACDNIDGIQTLEWVAANGIDRVGGSCVCMDGDPIDCPNGPDYCIDPGECCNPDDFYYCPVDGQCIENGVCCGPDCECRPGYEKCPTSTGFQCVPVGTCVQGCFDYAQVGSYCVEIVGNDGALNQPWATIYPSDDALNSFFGAQVAGGSQNFSQARSDQEDACGDGDPSTPCYPVYGKATRLSGGAVCEGIVCNYGQECSLSVTCRRADANGYCVEPGPTAATCVDAVCDPCDAALPACTGAEGVGECCYDAATAPDECDECDPLIEVCCEPGEIGCVPLRGVAIEVVPNVIEEGGSCLILWASQGMESVTLEGDRIDTIDYPEMVHDFAGATLVRGVETSTVYKISGTGTDGQTYEASDICAVRPMISEV